MLTIGLRVAGVQPDASLRSVLQRRCRTHGLIGLLLELLGRFDGRALELCLEFS